MTENNHGKRAHGQTKLERQLTLVAVAAGASLLTAIGFVIIQNGSSNVAAPVASPTTASPTNAAPTTSLTTAPTQDAPAPTLSGPANEDYTVACATLKQVVGQKLAKPADYVAQIQATLKLTTSAEYAKREAVVEKAYTTAKFTDPALQEVVTFCKWKKG